MSACHDLIIIGAGPAGLAAAALACRAGVDTLVIDENPSPGGQIYRAIEHTPVQDRAILGPDYWHGADLLAKARAAGVQIQSGTTVWSLDSEREIGVLHQGQARMLRAREVILATGALERPFPIPGWTLPGVMTAGAAQTLFKSSGAVPQGRTVLAGTGPLLWLLAAQLLRAGVRIEAMLDTTQPGAYLNAISLLPGFLTSPLFAKGSALVREVKRQVRVVRWVTDLTAEGKDRLSTVRWSSFSGREGRLDIDQLLLHQGVVPNVNLAMAAGIAHQWDDSQLCFRPVLNAWGESSVPGISITGDGAGIAGAWAAEARGRWVAMGVVRRLMGLQALGVSDSDEKMVQRELLRHELGRAFLDKVFRPADNFRIPTGDTLVCRCEEVTAAKVLETTRLGCEGPNQMKAFLRCGMGPCQGRLCGLTVTELIARGRGSSPAKVGYYRLRPPVKPITLQALAAMPTDEGSVKAVVRG
jgi:thioredoxin reductase